jgi:HEAT repeat protein
MKPFTPRNPSIDNRVVKLIKVLEKGWSGQSAVPKLASIGRANPGIVSLLLLLFENADPYVRINAAHTLIDMGESAAAIPQLIALLNEQDLEILLSAIRTLGDIGVLARSVTPQLILLLQHPNTAISTFAADALKKMGELSESSIAELILLLKTSITETNQGSNGTIADILADKEQSTQLAIPQLVQLLTDLDPDIRSRTVLILGRFTTSASLVTPAIIPLLKDSDLSIRSAVFTALQAIGAPVAPNLIALLKDKDLDLPMRNSVITTLNAIGILIEVPISELIQLLISEDPNSDIYRHVQDALRSIGKPAIPDLIILLKNPDKSISDRALSVFFPNMLSSVEIPEEFMPSIIPELVRLLNRNEDERSDDNIRICYILASMGKAVIPDLIILLQDPDSLFRGFVLYLLGDLAEWLEPDIPALLKILKDEASNPTIFNGIFNIMSRLREPAIPHLIILSNDSNPSIRRKAIRLLAYIGEPAKSAIPQLRLFLKDANLDLRMNAMTALVSMGEPLAEFTVSEFVPFFKDINEDTRRSAVSILKDIGRPAIPQLILFLKDPEQSVRSEAVYALEFMGGLTKIYAPELIRILKKESDSATRDSITLILGKIGKSTIPSLIPLLQDPDPSIRYCGVRACTIIADTASINITSHLIPLLNDPDAVVRSWTAIALGTIGKRDQSVIPIFIPLLQDPDQGMRSTTVEVLRNLGLSAQLAIPRLILCLKDSTMGDRTPIVTLLGKLGKPAQIAIPHLAQILKDPNSEVNRDELIAVLKKLRSL